MVDFHPFCFYLEFLTNAKDETIKLIFDSYVQFDIFQLSDVIKALHSADLSCEMS